MSQFDKDDVEDLGLLKLDVLGIRMQSAMAHAVERGPPGRRHRRSSLDRRPDCVALDDPADLRPDPVHPHPRLLPDRVTGAARADRQVRARDVRRPDHRHLAVPARPGQVRHGHAVPAGPAGLDRARVPPRRPAPGARGDLRRRRLPRAGHPDRRRASPGCRAGRGRRGPPRRSAHPTARPRCASGSIPRALAAATRCPRSSRSGRCSRRSRPSGSARPTRRRSRCRPTSPPGSRPTTRPRSSPVCSPTTRACTPSGSSSTTPASSASRSCGLDVNASDDVYRVEPVAPGRPPPASSGSPAEAPTSGLPTAAYGIRLALAEVKGITAAEVARIVAGRPYATLADFWHRARVVPPGRRAARRRRGLRQPLRHRVRGPVAAPRPGHPPRPAPPGRRPRPLEPGRRAGCPAHAPGHARLRARSSGRLRVRTLAGGSPRPRPRTPSGHAARPRPRRRPEVALRAAGDDRGRARARRARRARPRREPARRRLLRPVLDALGRHPLPATCCAAQPGRGARRRGQGRHPDPADPLRPSGRLPHPRRRAPARSTRRSSRTPRALTPQRSSTPGCWSCAVHVRRTGPRGLSLRATGCVGAVRAVRHVGDRGWPPSRR